MCGLELTSTDHHRALELGPTIDFTEPATRRGFRLRGRQFVGQLGEQLASAGTDLVLALSCCVSPALHTQISTRALVAQPLAESELFKERRRHIPNGSQAAISRSVLTNLQLALRAALHEAGRDQVSQRSLRAAYREPRLLGQVGQREVGPPALRRHRDTQRGDVAELDQRANQLHTGDAALAALLPPATVGCVQRRAPGLRRVEITPEVLFQLAQKTRAVDRCPAGCIGRPDAVGKTRAKSARRFKNISSRSQVLPAFPRATLSRWAKAAPNLSHRRRIVSWLTITPRSNSSSSMSRRLGWKRIYQRSAWLRIAARNRRPWLARFGFITPSCATTRANVTAPSLCTAAYGLPVSHHLIQVDGKNSATCDPFALPSDYVPRGSSAHEASRG